MKIGPLTESWNEGERDWSFVKDPTKSIEMWESKQGARIPDDYRSFLLKYNGGYVYPRMFHLGVPEDIVHPAMQLTLVDALYDWTTVESHFNQNTFGSAQPRGYLDIGDTPGGVEVLIGLAGEARGKVFAWPQKHAEWGSEENREVYLVAASFNVFLDMLFDDEDQSDFEEWDIFDELAKDLER